MVTCWACTVAKAVQKNIMHFSLHKKIQVPGQRVLSDLLSMQLSNWRILVDKSTNFKISHFFYRKDQMAEASCELLKAWKN